MKSIFFGMFGCLCVVFYACSSSDDTIPEPDVATGNIYGVITVKSTAEPMRATGVELYIGYSSSSAFGPLLLKTVTYDDGHYEFNDLEEGTYRLKVVAEGYEDASFKIYVEAGRTARADMQLTKEIVNTYLTVQTLDITNIGYNTAALNGSYSPTTYSYERPTECGFYYAAHSNPVDNGTRITGTETNRSFSASVSDLKKGTYYVQAYAKNSYGVTYGEERTFQISGTPVVTTLAATNVTENTATLNAKIEYVGDPAYTERGFVYSSSFQNPTVDDPADATVKVSVSGTSTEFSANISGLTESTTYYTRAYLTNSNGTVYGESVSFKYDPLAELVVVLPSASLMVHKNDISAGATWNTANQLCKDSAVGNFSNWRLPTIGELETLYDNRNTIGGFGQYQYWSSSGYINYGNQYYYYLSFYSGKSSYVGQSNSYHVRCVRSLAQ